MTIREALKRANKQLMPKIDSAMTREVFEAVRKEESAAIYAEVYKVYTPKMYDRRGEYGGLGDPDNIEILGCAAQGGVMVVVNVTQPNSSGCIDNGRVTIGKKLPELVENGDGYKSYHYDFDGSWKYMQPRPFTAKTIEHLEENRAHVAALKEGLKRQGVKVE